MKHLISNYSYIDDLPEGAKELLLTNVQVDTDLIYPNSYGTFNWVCSLPPGNWKLIGWSDEITVSDYWELETWEEILRSKGIKQRCLILKNDKP